MLYETVIPTAGFSFRKKNFIFKHFPPEWHYHPDFELITIVDGYGKRFAGNGVSEFKAGDVVLFGANVPHFHLSDKVFYENNDLYCCSDVIQFTPRIFPADYETMPEFTTICQLLKVSERGIFFHDQAVLARVRKCLMDIESMPGIAHLLRLYEALNMLGGISDYTLLSPPIVDQSPAKTLHNMPVFRTYQYLIQHFKDPISLQEVADYAGQNTTALCRNFKQSTGRSIFDCLLEIRIDAAYKLLLKTNLSVIQVAYESGFRNISHFNHKFKEQSGLAPMTYRKVHQAKVKPDTLSR